MIVMSELSKDSGLCDSRAVYIPPSMVRISDLNRGEGREGCMPTGSGDVGLCNTGNTAGFECRIGNSGDCPKDG
jgi:hypothetical protein